LEKKARTLKRTAPLIIVGAIVITVVAVALLIMPKLLGEEANGLPNDFNGLPREQQVLVCAGCHPSQHANELLGPHANAYKMLEAHISDVNAKDYAHRYYTDFVNKVGHVECIRCHATDNLFGNWFETLNETQGMGILNADGNLRFPKVRADSTSYRTGVDCLTCHYDGKRVVAGENFRTTVGIDPLSSCMPASSSLLSSDKSCLPCHASNMADMENIYFPGAENGIRCMDCHGETDSKGKSTHYTYWRNDPADKPANERLSKFYRPVSADLKDGTVLVRWRNEALPHRIGECPEMVVKMQVTDGQGRSFGQAELRFNLKELHDGSMMGAFDGKILPGVHGISPVLGATDTVLKIDLTGKWKGVLLQLEVTGIGKPQYWEGDAIGKVRHRSLIQLH
jgi:hypothetical protein